MNCVKGDLAVIVRSWAGNEGKIVRCLRLSGSHIWSTPDGRLELLPTWVIDRHLRGCMDDSLSNEIADDQLRPIRNDPGADETLTWRDVPTKEAA